MSKDVFQSPSLRECQVVGCKRRIPKRFFVCSVCWFDDVAPRYRQDVLEGMDPDAIAAQAGAAPLDNPFLDSYLTRLRQSAEAFTGFIQRVGAEFKKAEDSMAGLADALRRAGKA